MQLKKQCNTCGGSRARNFLRGLIPVLGAFYLSGCATVESPIIEPEPEENNELLIVVDEQQRIIEDQQQKIEALERQLAKKNIEIKQKNRREKEQEQVIEAAGHEITRTQIKLHRLATKSSAASVMAEAEIAMETTKGMSGNPADEQLKVQAQQLLDAASAYFAQDDYALATHYASQAVEFINMVADVNRDQPNRPIVTFNSPVRVQASANVNLRQTPGTRATVREILPKGTDLMATAYQGNWLRVQTDNNLQGWVSNTLIKVLSGDNEF